MDIELPTAKSVDIMLLLEGTFPFVSGGVSSWVHQIITGFPELEFGAVFIGSREEDYDRIRYGLPPNLKHLQIHFLHEERSLPPVTPCKGDKDAFNLLERLHDWFDSPLAEGLPQQLKSPRFYSKGGGGVDYSQFLYAERSWGLICQLYSERSKDPSFVDYFWTVRNMHGPLWQLAEIATGLIPARLYHTVSTGYAGFLGGLLHHHTGRPLILSEHGIYTKERRIDIFKNEWIHDSRNAMQRDPTEISYFRELWIRFFETVGRFCYHSAEQIVSLYEGVRQRQISDGADPAKICVIPNGIDLVRFSTLCRQRDPEAAPVIALFGRVVPIKDVKSFLRSVRILLHRFPSVQGWVVGPTEEDPSYLEECRALTRSLDIDRNIRFTGYMTPEELFPRIRLLVLSSISEGLPLVALEGFAAGLPLVATDVGCCRQLVEGVEGEDRLLGSAGEVVPINDPQSLAAACGRLLNDRQLWESCSKTARKRVSSYYSEQEMFAGYREIYLRGLR